MNLEEVKKECIEFINKRFDALATETEKFEVGKWYMTSCGNIVNFRHPDNSFGFSYALKTWLDSGLNVVYPNGFGTTYRLATPSEVEAALIKEAEKRGFKEGVSIHPVRYPNSTWVLGRPDIEYSMDEDLLMWGSDSVYQRGKWAEVIKEEPIEINGYGVEFHERGISFGHITIPNGVLEKIYNKQFKK